MYWWIKVRINKTKIFILPPLKKVLYKEKVNWSPHLTYRKSEFIEPVKPQYISYKIDVLFIVTASPH